MPDNEIIKALECCQNKNGYDCDDCPYQEIKHFDKEKGFEIMPNGMTYDTLSCDIWLQKDTLDLINRQKVEIERLNKEVDSPSQYVLFSDVHIEDIKDAKSYQEFVERLHEALRMYDKRDKFNKSVFLNTVDNVKKEKVGEDNARKT